MRSRHREGIPGASRSPAASNVVAVLPSAVLLPFHKVAFDRWAYQNGTIAFFFVDGHCDCGRLRNDDDGSAIDQGFHNETGVLLNFFRLVALGWGTHGRGQAIRDRQFKALYFGLHVVPSLCDFALGCVDRERERQKGDDGQNHHQFEKGGPELFGMHLVKHVGSNEYRTSCAGLWADPRSKRPLIPF